LFYDPLPAVIFSQRAVSALNHARQTCATVAAWQPTDTMAQRRDGIREILSTTIDDEAAVAWGGFCAPLPQNMTLSELCDYLWVDNAQQRNEVLQAVAERLGEQVDAAPEELDRVRVMTMHGAKGLSAQVVFIPGLEHGLLPNRHQVPYPAQLLEAARLLYVSITRARAACVLSFAARRTVNGQFENRTPSQFAMQTGGAFVPRDGGMTAAEATAIAAVVAAL
jgi:superfamily I DNA/RNA helicase